jgi:hypothetical protein
MADKVEVDPTGTSRFELAFHRYPRMNPCLPAGAAKNPKMD